MTIQYLAKALYAGAVAFLGPIVTLLLADDKLGFGDVSLGVWGSALLFAIIAFGGVLGLQAAPATVATGIKSD